jgi:hypothetical protein
MPLRPRVAAASGKLSDNGTESSTGTFPSTIDEGFEELCNDLEVTDPQEETVSTRQNVRKALEGDFKILDSFLTGSYRRSTMILPLTEADVDILIVLDPKYYGRSVRPGATLLKIGMNFSGRVHTVP